MIGFRRTAGKLSTDAENDIAFPTAIHHAIMNGEKVEDEHNSGVWAAAEFNEAAAIAHQAIGKFVL